MEILDSHNQQDLSEMPLDFQSIPVTRLVDEQGFTLLHQAVLKGREGMTDMLIQYARR